MNIKNPLTTKKHFTEISEESSLLNIKRGSAPDNIYECTNKTVNANKKRSKSKLFVFSLTSKADKAPSWPLRVVTSEILN
jgi:hypothetical protein